jgi:hypothetical protein
MVDLCLKEIEVGEGVDLWSVWLPTRAHIYTGYEAKWTRLPSTTAMISKD